MRTPRSYLAICHGSSSLSKPQAAPADSILRMTASHMSERAAIDDGALEYFESSLESLFGQHQAATGEAGQLCTVRFEAQGGDDKDDVTVTYRIPASASNRLFAHYQWDAGVFLARLIHRSTAAAAAPRDDQGDDALNFRPEADVRALSVCELGAGTGLPGLLSARRGASHVVLSDYPDDGILSALQENIRLSDVQQRTRAYGLDWSDEAALASLRTANTHGFERVLCADVLWLSASHAPLLHSIRTLMAPTSTARCIIVSGFHTGRRAIARFFTLARNHKTTPRLEPCREPDGGQSVFEYNVVTGQSRAWSGTFPFASFDDDDDDSQDIDDNMDDYTERSKWLSYVTLQWAQP